MSLLATPAHKLTAGVLASLLTLLVGLPARDEIRAQQWHLEYLAMDQVHAISTGEGVIVAVIDTGVDGGHPDLAGNLLPGIDLTFFENPDALEDLDGHGTAMAGLIAAHGRALGIAPDATILPIRVATDRETMFDGNVTAGIDWAVEQGASVLCLAFAGAEPNILIEQAIQRAIANDVVVIAGVGNAPDDQGLQYPAAYPGVVGAAGIDRAGNHAAISVTSAAADLAAPAVEIMTPRPRNVVPTGYGLGHGTSDATAIIAGVAALIRAEFPQLSAEDVIHRMTATADDRGEPGRDDQYGYGVVNPLAALTADIPPLNPPNTVTPSQTSIAAPPSGNRTAVVLLATAAGAGLLLILIAGLILARRRRA